MSTPAAIIVLAAGEGTRMKSALPKVLHKVAGLSMISHALNAADALSPQQLVAVVRHQREHVAGHIAEFFPHVLIADQDDIKGTGRAVQCALSVVTATEGTVLVTYGDVPMLNGDTLKALAAAHEEASNGVTVMSAHVPDPTGYGRILRSGDDVLGIVEHGDASDEQRQITEINSGIYAFDMQVLRSCLAKLKNNNAQGEVYLTDVLALAREAGSSVRAFVIEDIYQVEGVNDRVQLATLGKEMNARIVEGHMRNGVTIVDPATTWIDATVSIGRDSTVLPNTQLQGATSIGQNVTIGPDTTLKNLEIADGATIIRTHGSDALIGEAATVGPFAYLRPGTELGTKGKIGTFVEVKNSLIGEGSKVPHLSYVGDATIGHDTNIGAAAIFANYDGVNKHRTTIGNYVRTGSDSVFVAPVTLGDGSLTGAGTVVRKDVPPGALAVTAASQRNLEGWTALNRPGSPAAHAAEQASS